MKLATKKLFSLGFINFSCTYIERSSVHSCHNNEWKMARIAYFIWNNALLLAAAYVKIGFNLWKSYHTFTKRTAIRVSLKERDKENSINHEFFPPTYIFRRTAFLYFSFACWKKNQATSIPALANLPRVFMRLLSQKTREIYVVDDLRIHKMQLEFLSRVEIGYRFWRNLSPLSF